MSANEPQVIVQRIAFATDDGQTISAHFGRASQYTVISLRQDEIIEREERAKFSPHSADQQNKQDHDHDHNHSQMVEPIRDCQLVVAGGCGMGAQIHLQNAGISLILTGIGSIDEACKAFVKGELVHEPDRLHHGHSHQHHD